MRIGAVLTFLVAPAVCLSQVKALICIDPGHPSEVGMGASGKCISEVRANWLVANKLEKELIARGFGVVMTKSAEREKVTNQVRAEAANSFGADLMIRLHCDGGGGSGFMTVFPDRQGRVRNVTGPSRGVIASSGGAARAFHSAATAILKGSLADRGVTTDIHTAVGSKQGALTGSIFSRVPVILIEMAVLTNARDDEFIASEKGRALMVKALADGVVAAIAKLGKGSGTSRLERRGG